MARPGLCIHCESETISSECVLHPLHMVGAAFENLEMSSQLIGYGVQAGRTHADVRLR